MYAFISTVEVALICSDAQINSRVMVDKQSFARVDSNYDMPLPESALHVAGPEELTEEQLLLASPIVYGFSLSDKLCRTYPYSAHANHSADRRFQSSTTSTISAR